MMTNEGDDDGGIDFGFDEGGLDLSFGEGGDDPADLNESDMSAGTEKPAAVAPPAAKAPPVVQDLSGASAPKVPVTDVKPVTPPPPVPPVQQTQQPVVQPGATEQPQPSVNIEEFVAANADAIIGNLATTHFKIDPKTAEALGFAPEVTEFIEKQNAKNFLLTMVQVNNALRATLPTVVANLVDLTNRTREVHDGFYGDFPALKEERFVKPLKELAVTLRGLNPTMAKAEFVKLLGETAHSIFKLPLPVKTNAPVRPGVRRGQPRPFTPAGASAPQTGQGTGGGLAGLDFLNAQLRAGDE
jgi:hypothetical protein